jgi:hypothetical protein
MEYVDLMPSVSSLNLLRYYKPYIKLFKLCKPGFIDEAVLGYICMTFLLPGRIVNHQPLCSCPNGYVGDPFVHCKVPEIVVQPPTDPCIPTPCGPYANCKNKNNVAACVCQENYIGAPPNCRPECITDSNCRNDKACIQQRCRDPCSGTCGDNAGCKLELVSKCISCTLHLLFFYFRPRATS